MDLVVKAGDSGDVGDWCMSHKKPLRTMKPNEARDLLWPKTHVATELGDQSSVTPANILSEVADWQIATGITEPVPAPQEAIVQIESVGKKAEQELVDHTEASGRIRSYCKLIDESVNLQRRQEVGQAHRLMGNVRKDRSE